MLCISVGSCLTGTDAVARDESKVNLWQGNVRQVKGVTLESFIPENNPTGTAVIVCPGGSYCWLDYQTEGIEVAKWLQSQGIAAFVLKYRVQGKFNFVCATRLLYRGNHHPDMIMDLQRAIRYVSENAGQLGVKRVGAMGFSAGGHLVMCGAEMCNTDFAALKGMPSPVSLRPDFVAAVYPVVTMSDDAIVHKRSRRALLGEYHVLDRRLRDSLSVERHVRADCSPVFLVNCVDDPVVDYRNSVMLDSALSAAGVAHKYVQYATGGHGFGASSTKGSDESREWKNEFMSWFNEIVAE